MTSTVPRLLPSLLAAALAACGGSTPSQPTTPAPAPAATEAPAPAAGGAPTPTADVITKPGPNPTANGVVFNFKPDGKPGKIFLAGTFNDWKPSDPKFLMSDADGDGTWSITVKLPPGTYQYKYVADDKWIQDEACPGSAPDGFGGRNSQFDVK
ncbi:MAG TPA: glycogen-binding domain-containing protein [Kofleriaceae bacterium]|nr:glycogen-binding domain-containing protein [Kofleriaceae bacterium]